MDRLEEVNNLLWKMHKLLNPGEYGLGDELTDKQAFEQLAELVRQAIDVTTGRCLKW